MATTMSIKNRIGLVLQAEANAINQINIDDSFEQAISIIQECPGSIISTGIGKAGIMAEKFSATLRSGTTTSYFVHPAESAHGDLGLLTKNDVLVVFSTSGKSREVIEMLTAAKKIGVSKVIGITSHPDSELRKFSDVILNMGLIEEPCPLGLTPSASSAVMLAIGDAIALSVLELKGITKADFVSRHHAGYLGKSARNDD